MNRFLKQICLSSLLFVYNYAKSNVLVSNQINLKWSNEIGIDKSIQGVDLRYLEFVGAKINLPSAIPIFLFFKKISEKNVSITQVFIENQVTSPLTIEEQKIMQNETITTDFLTTHSIEYEKKTPLASVTIVPIRKINNQYEKLISFTLRILYSSKSNSKSATNIYASNSVLSSGSWFKVGVTKDGIYKIDYRYLKKIGVDVASVSPQNLRVYGNAGKQLPFLNSAPRIDDLQENPIMVVGEADGVLDSLDYFWFYAHSPNYWNSSSDCSGYRHQIHDYSDTAYYFVNYDIGPGLRLSTVPQSASNANIVVTSFDDVQYTESEAVNMRISGREFYGEKFDNLLTMNFDFTVPNIDINDSAFIKASFLGISSPPATFKISCQNAENSVSPKSAPALGSGSSSYTQDLGVEDSLCLKFLPNSQNVSIKVDFIKNALYSSGYGYLNFLELITRRQLKLVTNFVHFRDGRSIGAGNIAKFVVGNAQSNSIVLNVTNPLQPYIQSANYVNNSLEFTANSETLNEYFAFTPGTTAMLEPYYYEKIPNQNLHATSKNDMIIISHPLFLAEAERLKKMHESTDGLKVIVVTPQQIYNEYSSGMQDLTALRIFAKMLYNLANTQAEIPKYLLLFGDASYNNRNRNISGNTNFVPVYETAASLDLIQSYCTDDFFGLLDDDESDGSTSLLDIAIGRLPAKTKDEAKAMVDKIIDYTTKKPIDLTSASCVSCLANNSSSNVTGDWRNVITFLADDGDDNNFTIHVSDAESNADTIAKKAKEINIEKIYIDTYKQITDAGGQRYPDVNKALNERMNKGALIINYSGHGGEIGWAAERILGIDDIKKWKNKGRYPFFVTATCEFTRYDDPGRTSAGELTILQPDGGGVGLATTTRLVYQSANKALNNAFYSILFERDSITKEHSHIGEVLRQIKNNSGVKGANARKFALMGDPAIALDFPKYNVVTSKVEVLKDAYVIDTVKALSKVKITGIVTDYNNQKLTNFTGVIYPTIYDKISNIKTLDNDRLGASNVMNVKTRKSIIYKGKVSVTNGNFSFEFIVPKDIAYQYGNGRISYYAETDETDATGYYEDFIIGGINENATADNTGPTVKLFMNDDKFVSGSLTNENPKFIALVEDENGINTVGNGIGHDISAILDGKTDKSLTLNDYYQSELNSYQKGNVLYAFSSLSEGNHNIKFKVWDVYNNSTDANIDFVVAKNANVALNHVLNYPNPFTTKTTFMFEHNKPCQNLEIQIQIFSVSGKLVKSIVENLTTTGFRSQDINWDGLDDYGDKIGKGVYIYKLKVTAQDGTIAEQIEKLVLLN